MSQMLRPKLRPNLSSVLRCLISHIRAKVIVLSSNSRSGICFLTYFVHRNFGFMCKRFFTLNESGNWFCLCLCYVATFASLPNIL